MTAGGGAAGTVVDCVVVVSVSVCAIAKLLVRANATTDAHKKLLITSSIKSRCAHSSTRVVRTRSGSTPAITPTVRKGCHRSRVTARPQEGDHPIKAVLF